MMEMLAILFMINQNSYHMKNMIQNMLFILTINYMLSMNNMWMDNSNIYLMFYQDKYCSLLIMLTLWMAGISLMITKNKQMMTIMSLMMLVIMTLSSTSIIMFYIWFETSLIPLFIIIFWWGSTKEREMASMYMLIYTMIGSLPLMLTIFTMYKITYSTDWTYIMLFNIKNSSFIIYWNMIVAFLVKIPVFGFHTWLPKAHVEAPVYGSMILASVILKLGGMGLMRMMMTNLNAAMKFNSMFITIMMLGSMLITFICMIQSDMKLIVAYSSVVHMGIASMSMMTMYKWGYTGAMTMMIGHGLCSSSMFFIVNMIYLRSHSRIIIMNKGIINIEPVMMFFWFITCVGNLGAPISLNFLSELIMTNSIVSWSLMSIPFLIIINMLSSIYSMQLFMITAHGNFTNKFNYNIKMIEYHTIILHIVPLNMLTINSWMWNMNY